MEKFEVGDRVKHKIGYTGVIVPWPYHFDDPDHTMNARPDEYMMRSDPHKDFAPAAKKGDTPVPRSAPLVVKGENLTRIP